MIAQILFFMLVLLACVLCKSLTFGQTHLFSPDRTVFRGERQVLPVLWYDLAKMEPESQGSLLSYLLNPPKLNERTSYYIQPENKNQPLRESIAHQPHSENKIYYYYGSTMKYTHAFYTSCWYLPLWSAVVCILILYIIVRTTQFVHLLIIGKPFAYKSPRDGPSSEERWNLLLAKLDKICDAVDKKDKEEREEEALVIETDKPHKD